MSSLVGIGDLCMAHDRLCLVLKFSNHEEPMYRRVLVLFVGNPHPFWIPLEVFESMLQDIEVNYER